MTILVPREGNESSGEVSPDTVVSSGWRAVDGVASWLMSSEGGDYVLVVEDDERYPIHHLDQLKGLDANSQDANESREPRITSEDR